MPATLVEIESSTTDDPREQYHRLWKKFLDAECHLDEAVKRSGPIDIYVNDLEQRARRLADSGWNRAKQLERSLKSILASDALSDEQRQTILTSLYGADGGRRRNPGMLTERERELVERYRALDTSGQNLVRALLSRLTNGNDEGMGDRLDEEKGGAR